MYVHAQGLKTTQGGQGPCDNGPVPVAFCMPRRHRHPGLHCFRRSIPRLHAPLSTLRVLPHGSPRMTRGQCGSLLLHCNGLSPSISCRSSRRTAAQWLAYALPCQAMPHHKRDLSSLLLGKCQDLRGAFTRCVAVERYKLRLRQSVESRKQQQRILRRLPECFSLFDQQSCPLRGRLRFRCGKPFDVHEWIYQCNLKLDFSRRSAGVLGKLAICPRARVSCSMASISAERSSDRNPALPHRAAAFSINPASVQCRASTSGWPSAMSANCLSIVSAIRAWRGRC